VDFELNREDTMIRDAIRDWVSKECTREVVGELDEMGAFPEKLFKKLSKLGFCGMIVPEEYEGEGKNILGACLVVEEIAFAYPALASCYISPTFFGGAIISELGSDEQKNRILSKIASKSNITSLAFSEPEDPDAEVIKAAAKKQGDGFVITGEKAYVSLADQADLLILLARTSDSEAGDDLTLFCLDGKADGIDIKHSETMGYRGANTCRISLTNVTAEPSDILGGEGQLGHGRRQLAVVNDLIQLAYAASAVGMAQGAFEYALQHAKQREQFGQVIGRFPAIGHMLTDGACKIDAARLMVYRAAWMANKGKICSKEIFMARCMGAEVAVKAAMDGLQVLGGYGYTMEYDIQRYIRDSVALFSVGKSLDSLKEHIGASYGLA
jgi:alkylation response protein AidB-like acyl-CoA dehydrogenase